MAWITADDLRGFIKNVAAQDETFLDLAVDVACGKVEDLCGPIEFATITDEVSEVVGSDRVKLAAYVTRTLTKVADLRTGFEYPLTDWLADGQVLRRRDKCRIPADILVSYETGYFDPAVVGVKAPAWARSMALHIGQQYLITMRRFGAQQGANPVPTGFLVPNAALAVGHDYLLAPAVG